MTVTTTAVPATYAGFPASSWAFAFRIWIAVIIALYAAFWLELDAASSAAITVAILATPTRGQAMEKAGFRLIGTAVGVTASIAIVGSFAQARDLILAAFAVWVGLCIYVAALSDGNRSYAAVLSGYTVALIAIQQLDMPHQVFHAGVERGAAIAVGIAAVALVNDLLAAPDRYVALGAEFAALHRRVRDEALSVLRGEVVVPGHRSGLLVAITALRSDIETLASESSSGSARRAAARSAAVALVAELHAVQMLEAMPTAIEPAIREGVIRRFDSMSWRGRPQPSSDALDLRASSLEVSSLAWAVGELIRHDGDAREALAALAAGLAPQRSWRTPFYRSHRIALASGLRAAVWLALTSAVFVLAGWPSADASLSLVAVVVGLGAMTPDPRRFTLMALIAAPIAILVGGVLEFVVLDGVTQFPLLALALLPVIIGIALLMTARNPLLGALSRLNLIFVLGILAPANPQTWDPQAYLFTSVFVCVAAGLLFATQLLLPPVTDVQRRNWLLAAARREASCIPNSSVGQAPEEALFRDAVRIAQIASPRAAGHGRDPVLEETVRLFGETGLIRLCDISLALLEDRVLAARARAALKTRDFRILHQIAQELQGMASADAIAARAPLAAASLFLQGRRQ